MKWKLLIACLLQVVLVRAQNITQSFDQKITAAARALTCTDPDEQNPVTLNATLVSMAASDSIAVIVKAHLEPGWHLYAYVPDNMPYIVIKCILNPDANVKAIGSWVKSSPSASAMYPGVYIYEYEAVFIHKLKKVSGTVTGIISTGLYYQTCNLRQCLPPVEQTFELKY